MLVHSNCSLGVGGQLQQLCSAIRSPLSTLGLSCSAHAAQYNSTDGCGGCDQHTAGCIPQQYTAFMSNLCPLLLLPLQSLRSRALQKPGSAAVLQLQPVAAVPAADAFLVSSCNCSLVTGGKHYDASQVEHVPQPPRALWWVLLCLPCMTGSAGLFWVFCR